MPSVPRLMRIGGFYLCLEKRTSALTPRLGFSALWKTRLSIVLFMEVFKSYCICSELRDMGTGYDIDM